MASLKFTLLLVAYSLLPLIFQTNPIHALHIGIQASGFPLVGKTCSRKCESEFCSLPTPFLRYGKYCGILYSGCPGEKPCDDLDACCMKHDSCIESKNNDYLNRQCTEGLISCIKRFKKSKRLTFKGNTCDVEEVADLVTALMETALLAGRFFKNHP